MPCTEPASGFLSGLSIKIWQVYSLVNEWLEVYNNPRRTASYLVAAQLGSGGQIGIISCVGGMTSCSLHYCTTGLYGFKLELIQVPL